MWVNNAFNAGSSSGYAAMGPAVAGLPLAWCFAVAAAPVVLGAGVAQAWRSRRSEQAPEAAEPVSEPALEPLNV